MDDHNVDLNGSFIQITFNIICIDTVCVHIWLAFLVIFLKHFLFLSNVFCSYSTSVSIKKAFVILVCSLVPVQLATASETFQTFLAFKGSQVKVDISNVHCQLCLGFCLGLPLDQDFHQRRSYNPWNCGETMNYVVHWQRRTALLVTLLWDVHIVHTSPQRNEYGTDR